MTDKPAEKEPTASEKAVEIRKATEGMGLQPASFADATTMATYLSKSNMVPKGMLDKPADILFVLMWGGELGIGPAQALGSIHPINGKAHLAAELMVGMVKNSPKCEYFQLIESTDEKATYETQRDGNPKPTSITWTIADARRAGLLEKDNWANHPAAMLRARASAALARAEYPDVTMGLRASEELDELPGQAENYTNPLAATGPPASEPPAPSGEEVPQEPEPGTGKQENIQDGDFEEPDPIDVALGTSPPVAAGDGVTDDTAAVQAGAALPPQKPEPEPEPKAADTAEGIKVAIDQAQTREDLTKIAARMKPFATSDYNAYLKMFEFYQLKRGYFDKQEKAEKGEPTDETT